MIEVSSKKINTPGWFPNYNWTLLEISDVDNNHSQELYNTFTAVVLAVDFITVSLT